MFQVTFASICMIGYGISLARVSAGVHYFGICLIALGLFVAVGLPIAWLASNNPRYGKRTTASAIQITVCNCSGALAPFVSFSISLLGKRELIVQLYPRREAPY